MRASEAPPPNSLVLYKNRPARVMQVGDKLELAISGGGTQRVRPKDVVFLHPGPVGNLDELKPLTGDVETACELLADNTATLAELAELVYGEDTPAGAWAAWQLVADDIYFFGTPDTIRARTLTEAKAAQAARERKAAEAQAWRDFLERVRAGGPLSAGDETYFAEVDALAFGQTGQSRVLRAVGTEQTPANAHRLLLRLGRWSPKVNPHPRRAGVALSGASAEIGSLPHEQRVDLTHLPAFAIDDEDNQDPDDALSVDGNRLWVHVADVSALVPPDSPADVEARARGATLYLPDGPASMLPDAVTTAVGVGLQTVSPALSFGLDLGEGGRVEGTEIVLSLVRAERVSYTEVEARLDEQPFRQLWQWAEAFRTKRLEAGASILNLPEVKLSVKAGEVDIQPLPRLRSRTLVAEAMLMAGEATARYAQANGLAFPYANARAPEGCSEPETLAAMYACRRKLSARQMTTVPGAHDSLGLEVYAQVTSPLRRYLDLVAHQQLRAHLRGGEPLSAETLIERIGAAETASGSVRRAERSSNRHWTLVYLEQHAGWQGDGVLVERREKRGTVIIPTLGLETQIPLKGDPPLDTVLPLVSTGVDLAELEAYFRVQSSAPRR